MDDISFSFLRSTSDHPGEKNDATSEEHREGDGAAACGGDQSVLAPLDGVHLGKNAVAQPRRRRRVRERPQGMQLLSRGSAAIRRIAPAPAARGG